MKFSIIVPIYNVEKYLPQCIDSILNQDYKDFELILVNDGSPDDSLSICRQYAEKDKRVRIINKPNGGSTSSRKAGAKIAKGEYVICVDSDDYVEQGYFSCVARSLDEFNPDIVVLSHYSLEGNKKILNKDFVVQDLLQDKEYEEVRDKFIYDPTDKNISNPGIISYSLWCKVVRREIYVKAQELVDDKIVIGEDMLCSLYCLKLAKSMVCLDESFYVYRILNNSMMHSYNVKKFEHFENTVKALVESEIVDDRRIYAYSFHALCNEYAGIAESVNSISEFRNKILETHKFKLLYDMASRVDKSKELSVPAFVEAGINILVSIILVHKLGLIGVAIGTIAGMTYRMAYQIYFTTKIVKNRKQWIFYKKLLAFSFVTLIGVAICHFVPLTEITVWNWVLHAFIYALIFGVLYLILSLLLFKKDVRYLKEYILK